MAIRRRLLRADETFTANLSDAEIVSPKNLHRVNFAVRATQNGATAPTLATLLDILDDVILNVDGQERSRISSEQLLALNVLLEGGEPVYVVPAGDNQTGRPPVVSLPVDLPAKSGVVSYALTYNAPATVDTTTVSVVTEESDTAPKGKGLKLSRFIHTPASTGEYLRALDKKLRGDLEAILINSTTIPTTTNHNTSARRTQISVDGRLDIQATWEELQRANKYAGDSTLRGVLDNYAILDLRAEPIPSGSLVEIENYADDTNNVTYVLVERLK